MPPRRPRRAAPGPTVRERILRAASDLFYANGVRAVGVDTITEAAGVAKRSLYHHFHSKEALVETYIAGCGSSWREWLRREVERPGTTPAQRIHAVFDALEAWFREPGFRGCAAMNLLAESGDDTTPGVRAAIEHKRIVHTYLAGLARDAGLLRPDRAAWQLLMIIDGATFSALMGRGPEAAREARELAGLLIAGG